MSEFVRVEAEIGKDHRLIAVLPADIAPGRVDVSIRIKRSRRTKRMSGKELAKSEFAGDWAHRTDLPTSEAEFGAWRRALWNRAA